MPAAMERESQPVIEEEDAHHNRATTSAVEIQTMAAASQEQFLDQEIDEQVASGIRLITGPRRGPYRGQMTV